MTTTAQPLQFGIFPTPKADSALDIVRLARHADDAGFDLVGIQDHPYQQRFLDTWTLIAFVLANTSRVTVFPDVANLPLRPARMIAKAAASLDILSGGRFELGIGAGSAHAADGIEAMGGPRRTPKEAVDAVEAAIPEIRSHWAGEGKFEGPPPAHPIGIWVGAFGPRMLRITGTLADGWVPSTPYLAPEAVPEAKKRIDDAAQAAGRDPGEIRRVYNVVGEFEPAQIADFVSELGFDGIVFATDDPARVDRLAGEVIPKVREEVASRR